MSITKMIRTIEKQHPGWKGSYTKSMHVRWTHQKTGQFVFCSGTPSDRRVWQKLKSKMRNALRTYKETHGKG